MMLSQDSESRSKSRVEQTHKARTPKRKKCGVCSCSLGFSAANPQFSKYILVYLVTRKEISFTCNLVFQAYLSLFAMSQFVFFRIHDLVSNYY